MQSPPFTLKGFSGEKEVVGQYSFKFQQFSLKIYRNIQIKIFRIKRIYAKEAYSREPFLLSVCFDGKYYFCYAAY